jgi:hypothetical protein
LDFIVQRSRDTKVGAKLIKKLLKRFGIRPFRPHAGSMTSVGRLDLPHLGELT